MSQNVTTPGPVPREDPSPYGEPNESSSTSEVAKDQAAGVGQSAADAGQHVAGVAKEEVQNVAGEAAHQAQQLLDQARGELSEQAAQQQQRVAGGLRSLSRELDSMADGSQESGVATDLARQAATKAGEVAEWLERRDPNGLLDDVKSFARRRPGAFLAIALGAGLAAGRLTRGLKDDSSSSDSGSVSSPVSGPSTPYTTPPERSPITDEGFYGEAVVMPPQSVPVEPAVYPPTPVVPSADVTGEQGYQP